ncbi:hypothetical protein NP233_g50 [Leucocoprinus birnbaumii]|uniref:ubiquitinyl hydrolase 1 n=1 Tax=Leucocoprinus birnbaumii TaxID=56174 RepID=A0AAD5W794_9AGAR|nr:hypothetical protein NP233_g50 [Leucocoprinus birnbaumii]
MNGTTEINSEPSLDLIGGPFAVIESDPGRLPPCHSRWCSRVFSTTAGVFSSLVRGLGVRRVELTELYDIEPWAVDHLDPYGLIFCFTWHKDVHRPTEFDDPAAERVWFANQLSDDACATHAILNVLFNCPDLDLGDELREFRQETREFSPVIFSRPTKMRGLAITNSPLLRRTHNMLARPADVRAALNAIAAAAAVPKLKEKRLPQQGAKRKPGRPPKSSQTTKSDKANSADENDDPTYHSSAMFQHLESDRDGWMDVARPALRLKMAKYGGSDREDSDIRFSLLAVVQDTLIKTLDELEFLKKDKERIESLLEEGWQSAVDSALHDNEETFTYDIVDGYEHPQGFAGRRMQRDADLMEMSQSDLVLAWQTTIQDGLRARVAYRDEYMRRAQIQKTDHLKRTFDYEPFLKGFITELHHQGLLNPLLNLDENGKKMRQTKKQKSE